MNTLEMAIRLRENSKLKAQCQVGDAAWKVKCVNGSIMWDDGRTPEFLDMSDCLLRHNNWMLVEENKMCEIYYTEEVVLNNGIGELPKDKIPTSDIFVVALNGITYTTRPIERKFAVPTNDKIVSIMFKYNHLCACIINY